MAIELQRRRPPSDHIVTDVALNLIKGFEGLHLAAYPDPASELARTGKGLGEPWTIGWGRTKNVKRGDRCTLDQANAWLREDVEEAAQIVRDSVTVPLTVGEFAALTSMAYNFGYLPKSLKACLNGGVTDNAIREPDARALRGKVDGRFNDPRDFESRLFHPADARRAGHARDLEDHFA